MYAHDVILPSKLNRLFVALCGDLSQRSRMRIEVTSTSVR